MTKIFFGAMLALLCTLTPALADLSDVPSGFVFAGAATLGITYAGSAGTAALSEQRFDRYLYVPVAGPWLDIAHRGRGDAGNKFLLAFDGVLQLLGTTELIGGLVASSGGHRIPAVDFEGRAVKKLDLPIEVRVSPAPIGRSGYGLGAVGTF